MSTCNFSKVNARRFYVVDNKMYYNDAEDCYQDDPIDGVEPEYKDWDEGLKKMQRRNVQKKLAAALEGLVEYLEAVCCDLCGGNVYGVAARFSNGETWYTKLDTERGPPASLRPPGQDPRPPPVLVS